MLEYHSCSIVNQETVFDLLLEGDLYLNSTETKSYMVYLTNLQNSFHCKNGNIYC